MVKTKLTLDMNRKSITPRIMAKQLDSGRIVEITVNCDGVLVTDSFDETRILTSKGENSFYSSSLAENPIIENLTNGKTTWKIPSDVLEIAGIVMGELRLLKESFVVSSMPFEICVEATVSSNEAKIPKNAVDFIKKAEEAAEKAKEYRDDLVKNFGDIDGALDEIIAIQEALINGDYSKNITLTDEATGSKYQMSVSNAKVILEEV